MSILNLQKEHDAQNDAYIVAKEELFSGDESAQEAKLASLANGRLNVLNISLEGISDFSGEFVANLDGLVSLFDDVILECADLTNRRKEIEANIMEMCKRAVDAAEQRDEANEHATAKLIDSLLATASKEGVEKMESALLDATNPLRLGFTLYEAYCKKNFGLANAESMAYLQNEAAARVALAKGDDSAAFAAIEKLMTSKVDTPEKYLLVSLNSFYHGFEEDAVRALDIGLAKFPENERLSSARNALG